MHLLLQVILYITMLCNAVQHKKAKHMVLGLSFFFFKPFDERFRKMTERYFIHNKFRMILLTI